MEKENVRLADDCPCVQALCSLHGNCVECVRAHRIHKKHIPECMQEVLRACVTEIAKQVELGVTDERPTPAYWEKRAK